MTEQYRSVFSSNIPVNASTEEHAFPTITRRKVGKKWELGGVIPGEEENSTKFVVANSCGAQHGVVSSENPGEEKHLDNQTVESSNFEHPELPFVETPNADTFILDDLLSFATKDIIKHGLKDTKIPEPIKNWVAAKILSTLPDKLIEKLASFVLNNKSIESVYEDKYVQTSKHDIIWLKIYKDEEAKAYNERYGEKMTEEELLDKVESGFAFDGRHKEKSKNMFKNNRDGMRYQPGPDFGCDDMLVDDRQVVPLNALRAQPTAADNIYLRKNIPYMQYQHMKKSRISEQLATGSNIKRMSKGTKVTPIRRRRLIKTDKTPSRSSRNKKRKSYKEDTASDGSSDDLSDDGSGEDDFMPVVDSEDLIVEHENSNDLTSDQHNTLVSSMNMNGQNTSLPNLEQNPENSSEDSDYKFKIIATKAKTVDEGPQKIFKSAIPLSQHYKPECPVCGQFNSKVGNMNRHIKAKHPDYFAIHGSFSLMKHRVAERKQFKEDTYFYCKYCREVGKTMRYKKQAYLTSHHRLRHGDIMSPMASDEESNSRMYQVKKNVMAQGSIKQRVMAMEEVLYNAKDQKFKCLECGHATKDQSHMYRHVNGVHRGLVAAKCHICGAEYKDSYSLKVHMKKVHKAFTEICKYCEKRYKTKEKLNTHVERWHELEFVQEEKLARSKQIEEDHSD